MKMTSDDLIAMLKKYIDSENFEMAVKVAHLIADECQKLQDLQEKSNGQS